MARNGKRSNLKETRKKHYTTRNQIELYKRKTKENKEKKKRRRT
jgi:hypothetical protein